jgi:hypothetical protein
MESLTERLQYLCSQSRCFWIDQTALPVCQRCLGLYTGFALTVVWLALSGIWRRGLAPRGVLALHFVLLLTAMAGGLHWIDPGPRWRLACGLWTGHVAALWIIGGLVEMRTTTLLRNAPMRAFRRGQLGPSFWTRSAIAQAVLAVPLLFALAMAFYRLESLGWWFWTVAALIGIAAAFSAIAAAVVVVTTRLWPLTTAPKGRACQKRGWQDRVSVYRRGD